MSRPLPRFTDQPIAHDPLAATIARREAAIAETRRKINAGTHLPADPADLRGIPCIAPGVGGTSPGTQPHTALRDHRLRRTIAA